MHTKLRSARLRALRSSQHLSSILHFLINPRRAYAARVTVLALSVCVCVCSLYHYRSNPSSLRPKSSTYRFIIGFCWISIRGFSKKTSVQELMALFAYHDYCRAIHGFFFDWISFSSCCEASCTLNLRRILVSVAQ